MGTENQNKLELKFFIKISQTKWFYKVEALPKILARLCDISQPC